MEAIGTPALRVATFPGFSNWGLGRSVTSLNFQQLWFFECHKVGCTHSDRKKKTLFLDSDRTLLYAFSKPAPPLRVTCYALPLLP